MARKVLEKEERNMIIVALRTRREKLVAKVDGACYCISFKTFSMPVLGVLEEGFYDLGSGWAKELSKRVWVVLLASASAALFFAEAVYDGVGRGIGCRQGKDSGFDWCYAAGWVETDESLLTAVPAVWWKAAIPLSK